MSPSHAVKDGKRYRYYTSQRQLQEGRRPGRAMRIPTHEIEALVRAELQALLQNPGALLDLLGDAAHDLQEQQALLAAATDLAARWPALAPGELSAIVRALLAKVVIGADQVALHLAPDALRRLLRADPAPVSPARTRSSEHLVLTVPAQLRRCGGQIRLIVPGRATSTAPARPNPALIKALVRAHAGLDRLRAGTQVLAQDLASTLPLACLAPDITQAILDGTQPHDLTLDKLRRPLPLAWPEQRRALGFPPAAGANDLLTHHPARTVGTSLTRPEPGPCP
jgi:hypothetical protein